MNGMEDLHRWAFSGRLAHLGAKFWPELMPYLVVNNYVHHHTLSSLSLILHIFGGQEGNGMEKKNITKDGTMSSADFDSLAISTDSFLPGGNYICGTVVFEISLTLHYFDLIPG
jgi:hypothetical protein